MEKVIVLMSTYNGEKYLKEQLRSIETQSFKPELIFVRDDGSTDNTSLILKQYKSSNKSFEYSLGANLGVSKSFLELIKMAPEADYYALSDQDDVWKTDKLKAAIDKLRNEDNNIPLLYIGKFTPVDEELHELKFKQSSLYNYSDFAHSLIYHSGPGSTFVFNNATIQILRRLSYFDFEGFHDSLIHKIVAMCGKVILDDISYILYRQHENNVIGYETNSFKSALNKFKGFTGGRQKNYRSKLAWWILSNCKNLYNSKQEELLVNLAGYNKSLLSKLCLIKTEDFKTHTLYDLIFDFLVLKGDI